VAAVAAIAVLVPLTAVLAAAAVWTRSDTSTVGRQDFAQPLVIPPLDDGTKGADGVRRFDLRLQQGRTDFGRSAATRTWGINGSHLGPTLRAGRGEQVAMTVENALDESTSLHWHGMHLPAAADGGPHSMIPAGGTWSPGWTVDQPAATLWYHPHLHGSTAEHVYRGLAGMFIVDDPSAASGLPDDYGTDDLPVIVQDKSFDGDGQLDMGAPLFSPTGQLGDTVLVNGTVDPYATVTRERTRLRLLNASNARVYDFGLVDDDGRDRSFAHVATDGGLLPAPLSTERIMLSPGERAEVVVEMRAGERLTLRSHEADLGTDPWNQRFAGGDDVLDVLQLRAAERLGSSPALPDVLAAEPDLRAEAATRTRTFRLSGTDINGRDMDVRRVDEVVTVGDTELWEVTNADGSPHNFHVHDVQFLVHELDGRLPPPALRGWKDTVYVPPGSTVRLLLRFSDYTDPDIPYMFHCHLLRHEDSGMMGQFVVVEPGVRPPTTLSGGHAHAPSADPEAGGDASGAGEQAGP
jgi:FtsP/CotA-like multicopper oxidase with cupredoxin domain